MGYSILTERERLALVGAMRNWIDTHDGNQSELSRQTGITKTTINLAYLHGKAGPYTMRVMCQFLKMTEQDLVSTYAVAQPDPEMAVLDGGSIRVYNEAVKKVVEENDFCETTKAQLEVFVRSYPDVNDIELLRLGGIYDDLNLAAEMRALKKVRNASTPAPVIEVGPRSKIVPEFYDKPISRAGSLRLR